MESTVFDPHYAAMLNKQYWNFRAKDYNERTSNRLEPEQEKENLIRSLLEQKIITPQSRVLDLGCGPGRFSRAFAPYVQEVVGIDISEEMLHYARKNNEDFSNTHFFATDWAKDGMTHLGTFDLVFANMCPAVYDIDTLKKMNAASHGFCYYSHFAAHQFHRIPLMFQQLWETGCYPMVSYAEKKGEGKLTLEQAITYYQAEYGFPEEKKDVVITVLKRHMGTDGMVLTKSWFKKGILFWEVNAK